MKTIRLLALCLMAVALAFISTGTASAQSEYIFPAGQPVRPPYRAIMDPEFPLQDWGEVLAYNAQAWTNSRFRGNGQEWRWHSFACQTGDTITSPGMLLEPGKYTITIKPDLEGSWDYHVEYLPEDSLLYDAIVRWGQNRAAISENEKIGKLSISKQEFALGTDYYSTCIKPGDEWIKPRHLRKTQEFNINVKTPGIYYLSMEVLQGFDHYDKYNFTSSIPFVYIRRTGRQKLKYVSIDRNSYSSADIAKASIINQPDNQDPYDDESHPFDRKSEVSFASYPKGQQSGLHKGDTICSVALFISYPYNYKSTEPTLYKSLNIHFYNIENQVKTKNPPKDGSPYDWMKNCTDSTYFMHYSPSADGVWFGDLHSWSKKITPAGFVHNLLVLQAQTTNDRPPFAEQPTYPHYDMFDYYRYEMPLDVPFVFQGPSLGVFMMRFENTVNYYSDWTSYVDKYKLIVSNDIRKEGYCPETLYCSSLLSSKGISSLGCSTIGFRYGDEYSSINRVLFMVLGVKPCRTEKFKVRGRLLYDQNWRKIKVEYTSGDVFYGTTNGDGYFEIDVDGVRDNYVLSFVDEGANLYDRDDNFYNRYTQNLQGKIAEFTYDGHDVDLGILKAYYSSLTSISPGVKLNDNSNRPDAIYDMQGRKVASDRNKLGNGIYIINGRKVIISGH